MKNYILLFALFPLISFPQTNISYEDKIRIAEAKRISDMYGEKLWQGWEKTHFALVLIYDEVEFLINHPNPSDDFSLIGFDTLLNSNIYYRPRQFNKHFLATFPAVNGVETIVVGTPANTRKSSIEWIITILHEHFHQYQYSQPGYYNSINSLALSGGDETGMWMLNYPFPYEDSNVNAVYDSCKKILINIFKGIKEPDKTYIQFYLTKRNELKESINENDYKYMSFQLWQEGIARYTEIKLLQIMLDDNFDFSDEMKKLDDYKSLKEHYDEYYQGEINLLNALSLNENKRNCFYEFGAFEGLLLDKVNPDWRKEYNTKKFFLEKLFTE